MSKKDVKRAVWALAVVVLGVLVCSCTEDYEVTKWRGAFIKNDTTIGVFKWKWDYYEATNIFAETQYDNTRQYYCEYNLNTGRIKRIKKLRYDEGQIPFNHNVVYNHPYVYFCTRTDLEYIGIYNIETKEDEIFKKGSKPICVSEDNRYLGFDYSYHHTFYFGIYNVLKGSVIWGGVKYRPIYISGVDDKALLLNLSTVNLLTGEIIDTLSINIKGRILHNASNDITVFESDSGGFYYLNNSELIEGIYEPKEIENLNRYGEGLGAGHVDITNQKALYSTGEGIYYINYGENKEAELILKYNREDL